MWKRSSKCSTQSCIEATFDADFGVGIRSSDRQAQTTRTIWVTPEEWAAFIAGVKAGEFDAPDSH